MGKKARKLRSPKYARKAAAFRNTVARLNNRNNNTTPDNNNNDITNDNVVTIPNALKTLNENETETENFWTSTVVLNYRNTQFQN